jgi:hypothetical protein
MNELQPHNHTGYEWLIHLLLGTFRKWDHQSIPIQWATMSGVTVRTGVASPAAPSGLRARLRVGHCNAGFVCGCRASRDMGAALLSDGCPHPGSHVRWRLTPPW